MLHWLSASLLLRAHFGSCAIVVVHIYVALAILNQLALVNHLREESLKLLGFLHLVLHLVHLLLQPFELL